MLHVAGMVAHKWGAVALGIDFIYGTYVDSRHE